MCVGFAVGFAGIAFARCADNFAVAGFAAPTMIAIVAGIKLPLVASAQAVGIAIHTVALGVGGTIRFLSVTFAGGADDIAVSRRAALAMLAALVFINLPLVAR